MKIPMFLNVCVRNEDKHVKEEHEVTILLVVKKHKESSVYMVTILTSDHSPPATELR